MQLVADRHSVNPQLLLAIMEHNAGWLTQKDPQNVDYLMGREQEGREGLYKQLSWGANMLNFGFYGRSEGGLTAVSVGETVIPFSSQISDGTAGVQFYLGSRDNVTYQEWLYDVGPDGLAATYRQLCGGQKARKKKAAVALARKIAVVAWAMLKNETDWDPRRMRIDSEPEPGAA